MSRTILAELSRLLVAACCSKSVSPGEHRYICVRTDRSLHASLVSGVSWERASSNNPLLHPAGTGGISSMSRAILAELSRPLVAAGYRRSVSPGEHRCSFVLTGALAA